MHTIQLLACVQAVQMRDTLRRRGSHRDILQVPSTTLPSAAHVGLSNKGVDRGKLIEPDIWYRLRQIQCHTGHDINSQSIECQYCLITATSSDSRSRYRNSCLYCVSKAYADVSNDREDEGKLDKTVRDSE